MADRPTVEQSDLPTVSEPQRTTVDRSAVRVWLSEAGELVADGRVHRIRLAQDVLNSAEEAVYNILWGGWEKQEPDGSRISQCGYHVLMQKTRLAKKTIQRVIDKLADKGFLEIAMPADIYRRSPTVYRVFSYRTVLERQEARGRFYVAKLGPGFVYVRRHEELERDLSTVAVSSLSTVGKRTTVTGDSGNLSTVVHGTTYKREQEEREQDTSTTARLRLLLEAELGAVDEDALRRLWESCRAKAADCTPEEVAYLVGMKLRAGKGIQNPVGFVLTAVPRHFENEGHLAVRELLRKQAERRREEREEQARFWRSIAENPASGEQERMEAKRMLEGLEEE